MASEKNFENKIKAYLKSIGAYFIKTHGDKYTRVGTPDIIACVNSHFVAIEVKAENGRASELQKYHVQQIKDAGGYACIVYPKDFENLKSDLEKILKGGEQNESELQQNCQL